MTDGRIENLLWMWPPTFTRMRSSSLGAAVMEFVSHLRTTYPPPPQHLRRGSGNCKPPTHQLCTPCAEVQEFVSHLRTTSAPPTRPLRAAYAEGLGLSLYIYFRHTPVLCQNESSIRKGSMRVVCPRSDIAYTLSIGVKFDDLE